MWERRREENRQRVMEERKCFKCGGFGHVARHCRNMREEGPTLVLSNKFKVLKDKVMQRGEGGGEKEGKDRKEILKEERAKRGIEVRQIKVEKKEKKEKTLREVVVKIGLKQEEEEGVVTETLLDNGATELVMSKEFARKHRFKRTKLERLIYVRNVDSMLNYVGPIKDTVEVKIFFKGHKERTLIDVIGEQKWSVILGIPWLACHNPEIEWKTGKVQIMRYLNEYEKKWRMEKQTKPEWTKQQEKEEKKEMKKLTTDEKIAIVRIREEKEDDDDIEDLIELRATEEIVPRWFHKYLKVFEKKDSERMPTKKA